MSGDLQRESLRNQRGCTARVMATLNVLVGFKKETVKLTPMQPLSTIVTEVRRGRVALHALRDGLRINSPGAHLGHHPRRTRCTATAVPVPPPLQSQTLDR